MTTSFPIDEQIAQVIAGRLADVKEANGYQVTVSQVVRPTRGGGYTNRPLTSVLVMGDCTESKEHTVAGNPVLRAWRQSYLIGLESSVSDKDTRPADQIISLFRADTIKAVCAPTDWHTMDGLALLAEFGDPSLSVDDMGRPVGVVLDLQVVYRVSELDPYTQG